MRHPKAFFGIKARPPAFYRTFHVQCPPVADQRLRAACETLREIGILILVLYPLEKSISRQIDWLWMTIMEAIGLALIVCGILFDRGES
ncbi:MAG: hypothetical protein DMG48_02320 [Acidobacteria bacterium]|nr:MAG: hypothetical protein DMG48_02320 [Acidobacteriota bacterium]